MFLSQFFYKIWTNFRSMIVTKLSYQSRVEFTLDDHVKIDDAFAHKNKTFIIFRH